MKPSVVATLSIALVLTSITPAEELPLIIKVLRARDGEPMPRIAIEVVPENRLGTQTITALKSVMDANGIAQFPLKAVPRSFRVLYPDRAYKNCSVSRFSRDTITQYGTVAETSCESHWAPSRTKAVRGTLIVFAEGGYTF